MHPAQLSCKRAFVHKGQSLHRPHQSWAVGKQRIAAQSAASLQWASLCPASSHQVISTRASRCSASLWLATSFWPTLKPKPARWRKYIFRNLENCILVHSIFTPLVYTASSLQRDLAMHSQICFVILLFLGFLSLLFANDANLHYYSDLLQLCIFVEMLQDVTLLAHFFPHFYSYFQHSFPGFFSLPPFLEEMHTFDFVILSCHVFCSFLKF